MKGLRLAVASLILLSSSLADAGAGSPAPLGAGSGLEGRSPSSKLHGADQIGLELGRLSSLRSEDRQAAEAYLALHLQRRHLPEVAQAAIRGGAEVRRRLSLAVGSSDQHLGLAMLLLDDRDEDARFVGREAIHEMLVRWSPSIEGTPLANGRLPDDWLERNTRRLRLAPSPAGFLARLDRFARLGGGPVPIVLGPALQAEVDRVRGREDGRVLLGNWPELLDSLMLDHRLTYQLHGYREGRDGRAWLRIAKIGDRSELNGEEHFVRWLRGVVREQDPVRNRSCARALGASGWPAVLRWFEERWLEEANEAALFGLLEAAARGRVAPSLALPDNFLAILAFADRASTSAAGIDVVERVARGLAEVAVTGVDGHKLAASSLLAWDELSHASRWMRLVIIEGQAARSVRILERLRREIEEPATAALQFQALRALAEAGTLEQKGAAVEVPLVGQAAALFRWALETDRLEELGRLLPRTRVGILAQEWIESLPFSQGFGRALLAWGVASENLPLARKGLRIAIDSTPLGAPKPDSPLCRDLKRLGSFGWSEQVLTLLDEQAAQGDLLRAERARGLILRAGFAAEEEARALLGGMLEADTPKLRAEVPEAAIFDLAALCATPAVGWKARSAIVLALEEARFSGHLLGACELAISVLRGERMDAEAENLADRLRSQASRSGHPLTDAFLAENWPSPPEATFRDIDQLDRVWLE